MDAKPQRVNGLSQTVTVDTNVVSARNALNDMPLADRAVGFLQRSLWPVTAIAVAALSSVLWTASLLWLIGHAVW